MIPVIGEVVNMAGWLLLHLRVIPSITNNTKARHFSEITNQLSEIV